MRRGVAQNMRRHRIEDDDEGKQALVPRDKDKKDTACHVLCLYRQPIMHRQICGCSRCDHSHCRF